MMQSTLAASLRGRSSNHLPLCKGSNARTMLAIRSSNNQIRNPTIRHASSTTTQPAVPTQNPASRPFARHRPDLPQPKSYKTPAILLILFSLITWSAFTAHATNRERLSSAVLKNVVDKIRESEKVREAMGEDVNMKRETILAGDPWVRGSVNMMQGRVDMSFKLKGSRDTGTVYFSSIRRDAQTPYETLRFLIVLDSNKQVISLLDS
jgi:cytochrome c oxidase assembly factor 1